VHFREPRVICDKDGRIFVIMAGRPEDNSYDGAVADATQAMEEAEVEGSGCWSCNQAPDKNMRGDFAVINGGYSMGGGQKVHC
jgi:hypothetical protein